MRKFTLYLDEDRDDLLICLIECYVNRTGVPLVQSGEAIGSDKSVGTRCPICGWSSAYENSRNARRGLSAHMRQMHRGEGQSDADLY
jgi:hypothetical protein